MALKVKAYRVSKDNLKANKFPSNYMDLMDSVTSITPIKIRNLGSFNYHIAEDVKGDIFLIDDFTVSSNKLYSRNITISESPYLLDTIGKAQLEAIKNKKSTLQEDEVIVASNEGDLNNLPEVQITDIDLNENSEQKSEITGEINE